MLSLKSDKWNFIARKEFNPPKAVLSSIPRLLAAYKIKLLFRYLVALRQVD
jgi:hypothetical protein